MIPPNNYFGTLKIFFIRKFGEKTPFFFSLFLEIEKIVKEIRGVFKKERGLKEDLPKNKKQNFRSADYNFSKRVPGTILFCWPIVTHTF